MPLPRVQPIPPQPLVQSLSLPKSFTSQTLSSTAYVDVYLANNFTATSPGGKMHFDTFDGIARPGLFDTSNFWFNCPIGGRYAVKFGIGLSSAPAAEYTGDIYTVIAGIRRRLFTYNNPSSVPINLSGTSTVRLNAGDQMFINFTFTSGVNQVILGGVINSWLQITRESDF